MQGQDRHERDNSGRRTRAVRLPHPRRAARALFATCTQIVPSLFQCVRELVHTRGYHCVD
jgi:hypothetical protein